MKAAKANDLPLVKILLNQGADPKIKNRPRRGKTARDFARKFSNWNIAQVLLFAEVYLSILLVLSLFYLFCVFRRGLCEPVICTSSLCKKRGQAAFSLFWKIVRWVGVQKGNSRLSPFSVWAQQNSN